MGAKLVFLIYITSVTLCFIYFHIILLTYIHTIIMREMRFIQKKSFQQKTWM